MLERSVVIYFGDNFEVPERKSICEFQDGWGKGAIVERKMPCPTRRNPEKTKTVYCWIGEDSASIRGLSAQMPASVTVKATEGSFLHRMIVVEWGRNRLAASVFMVPA
jgi:hypothetical protein